MDLTFTINERDFTSRLSTYKVSKNISYNEMVTTMDGKEHIGARNETYMIEFSLFPMTETVATADYNALKNRVFSVTFTDPYNGGNASTKNFRVNTDLDSVFGLKNAFGSRYYKGSTITLRETAV